jgi:hypothetical protein
MVVGWRQTLKGLLASSLFLSASLHADQQTRPAAACAVPSRLYQDSVRGSASMGGASLSGDAMGFNPSHLAQAGPRLSLEHTALLFDASLEGFKACMPLPNAWGGLGLNVELVDFGEQQGYDSGGALQGGFKVQEQHGALSYGKALGAGLDAGLSLRASRQVFGAECTLGLGTDIGLHWKALDRLAFGVAASAVSQAQQPWLLRGGLAWNGGQERLPWVAGLQASAVAPGVSVLQAGFEASPGPVALRCGWRWGLQEAVLESGQEGLVAGLGVQWSNVAFDYAWQSQGSLGGVHRTGLSMMWEYNAHAMAITATPLPIEALPILAPQDGRPAPSQPAEQAIQEPGSESAVPAVVPMDASNPSSQDFESDVLTQSAGQALALEADGFEDKALQAFRACADAEPGNAACWRGVARLSGRSGHKEQTRQAWRKVRELLPFDEEAQAYFDANPEALP